MLLELLILSLVLSIVSVTLFPLSLLSDPLLELPSLQETNVVSDKDANNNDKAFNFFSFATLLKI